MLAELERSPSAPPAAYGAADVRPVEAGLADLRRRMLPGQMRTVMAVSFATWAIFAARKADDGHPWTFRINVSCAVLAASIWLLLRRFPRAAVPLSHAGILASVLGIVAIAWLSGQTLSPTLWYITAAPLFAGFLFGLRAAGIWAGVTAALIVGMEIGRRVHPITPELIIEPLGVTSRLLALVILLFLLAVATNRVHQSHIGALKQREATIRELMDGLTQKSQELTAARDEAVNASRAKSDFLAMMSHEIRTPLNGVLGLTSVLLDAELPAEQREIVRTIRSSGDALLVLLNDLLDFSKIEAGQLALERAPFSVTDCAEDAIDLFAATATEKGLDLYCITSPDLPARVEGDSARVRQILVNLISNAVKFTLRGGIEIRIDADLDGADPSVVHVRCSVRDTGIGIPEDMRSRLFKPFSQIDASTTRRFGGTGLGLAICRTLVERMSGKISVESRPGEGSTFHVTFPAKVVAGERAPSVRVRRSGRVALVVTPREGARAAVASQLEGIGFQVLGASTCAEARELLGRPVDIVLAEEPADRSSLPALLSAVGPATPIVLLTAGKLDPTARAALRERWGHESPIVALPARRALLRDAVRRATDPSLTPAPMSNPAPIAESRPLRILVAEDNPVNQRVALLLLEQLGYRADVAGNGAEAIEAVAERPYDVVFMDMRMPEVDGLEATRQIRATLPRERQPRIIALTANAMKEDRAACAAAGMDDFVAKPLMLPTLEQVLRAQPGAEREPPPAVLDEAQIGSLKALTATQPEILRELLGDYFAAVDAQLNVIRDGLSSGDAQAVIHAAHALKGGSGQMGATLVMKESEKLERLARDGNLEEARAVLPRLVRQHVLASEALRAIGEQAQGA